MGQWHLYRRSWGVARHWVRAASGPIALIVAAGSGLFLLVSWLLITVLHVPFIALRLLWAAGGLGSLAVLNEADIDRRETARDRSVRSLSSTT